MTHSQPTAGRRSIHPNTALPVRIIIAGGGTGGHLFPGIAMAEEFVNRNPANEILFVSTGNPFERSVLSGTPFRLQTIRAEGIKGRGFLKQVKAAMKVPAGIIGALRIINSFGPHLVIGVGSYAAGPVVVAAWLMGIPNVLHEQNALPGITNRILSGFATKIFLSFEDRHGRFKPGKTIMTGNPVRRDLLETVTGEPATKTFFTILIIGGSQGAHPINLAVEDSLNYLTGKGRYHFIHQTGAQDLERIRSAYRQHDILCDAAPFFRDMEPLYRAADLIICRAGATTIAEITAIGKGVIFIPFPFAADNHQVENARLLSEDKAAEMILQQDLTGRLLAERITHYACAPDALADMAARAKLRGKPDAGRLIVDHCYRLIHGMTDEIKRYVS